jgi:ribosomal protein L11 methylase PrmA
VAGLRWTPGTTEWSEYARNTSYSERATAHKATLVAELSARVPGRLCWDLGANTGHYSRIVADAGKRVLAFDIDPAAADANYLELRREGREDILPLVLDVANPSPGAGWGSEERQPLLARANADMIIALALVHHLAISRNVPLPMLVDLFARLAPWAIVEFVPKADPMVRRLLATRLDVFPDYDLDHFRGALAARFTIRAEVAIDDSPRVMFLLERRETGTAV